MPQKMKLKIAENGRVVIPVEFRKALAVAAGGNSTSMER
jgi:bifunctional DNA-binding transcriptional regulator/antitoxin component of YhaV-PrlF toxin-antitoxin module